MPLRGLKITFKHGPVHCLLCMFSVHCSGSLLTSAWLKLARSCIPVSPVFIYLDQSRAHLNHSDAVATDIVHMHSGRLDYYKG